MPNTRPNNRYIALVRIHVQPACHGIGSMLAVKGHYCNSGFYNYPYTFGLLFGLGLYARFQASPDEFRADYDDFLSSTGMFDAHTLASRFGIDTHSVEFWKSSLDVIRKQITEFEGLIK